MCRAWCNVLHKADKPYWELRMEELTGIKSEGIQHLWELQNCTWESSSSQLFLDRFIRTHGLFPSPDFFSFPDPLISNEQEGEMISSKSRLKWGSDWCKICWKFKVAMTSIATGSPWGISTNLNPSKEIVCSAFSNHLQAKQPFEGNLCPFC